MKALKIDFDDILEGPKPDDVSLAEHQLMRFETITQLIHELDRERDSIRLELLEKGPHSTKNYICSIETKERRGLAPIGEFAIAGLIDTLAKNNLIRVTTYKTVKVISKND